MREWARQLQAIKLFHEQWSATAKALGWHALDLFGCHRIAPYRRLDHAGMCLLDWPDRVVLMLPNAAVMRRDESRLVYRRKPLKPDVVAVWDV